MDAPGLPRFTGTAAMWQLWCEKGNPGIVKCSFDGVPRITANDQDAQAFNDRGVDLYSQGKPARRLPRSKRLCG